MPLWILLFTVFSFMPRISAISLVVLLSEIQLEDSPAFFRQRKEQFPELHIGSSSIAFPLLCALLHTHMPFVFPVSFRAVIDQDPYDPCLEIFCLSQSTNMLKRIQYRVLYGIGDILVIPQITECDPPKRHPALFHQGDKRFSIPKLCPFQQCIHLFPPGES